MADQQMIYHVALRNGRSSYVLIDLEKVDFHGVSCLKGKGRYAKEFEWADGKTLYIPTDQIAAVYEYHSWDDYWISRRQASGQRRRKPSQIITYLLFMTLSVGIPVFVVLRLLANPLQEPHLTYILLLLPAYVLFAMAIFIRWRAISSFGRFD